MSLPAAAAQQDDRDQGPKPLEPLERLETSSPSGADRGKPDSAKVATVVEQAADGDWTRESARLRRTYLRLHAKAQRGGERPGRNIAEDGVKTDRGVRPARNAELHRSIGVLRRKLGAGPGGGGSAASPQLEAIAACESGGNPSAVSDNGMYRGKYQFSRETWATVGGSGDPAAAPEAEQDRRAAALLARGGAGHWPVCG